MKERPEGVIRRRAWALATLFLLSASHASAAAGDEQLAKPLDRRTVLEAALARNPGVRAPEERATAAREMARAEGSLPPPELMGQVWQVPFSSPTAFDRQMIMVGATQTFPAPGSLGARARAAEAEGDVQQAMSRDRARAILREAGHAFADYEESSARHRIHRDHLQVMQHLFDVAQARHAAGGSLTDVVRAEVELSRVEADFVTDATLIESARAHLNALLAREPSAPLGAPVDADPVMPAVDAVSLLATARATRPELKVARSEQEARMYAAEAAEREATWPSFAVGALYFPPTSAMPEHGYGATLSVSLPWLWGAASAKEKAQRLYLRAAATEVEAARLPVDAEVVTAESKARSAAYRVKILRDRTLPASRRAFEIIEAGFESGRTDLMTILDARRAVVDVEQQIVMGRADLSHALTDLEAAVGAPVATRPIGAVVQGGDHVQ
ncbi:MAG TPA: TolC family protein [Polyangiaceae bacterium]|jgi:outer membrane protein TolC